MEAADESSPSVSESQPTLQSALSDWEKLIPTPIQNAIPVSSEMLHAMSIQQ
jgi:hypothetical protein